MIVCPPSTSGYCRIDPVDLNTKSAIWLNLCDEGFGILQYVEGDPAQFERRIWEIPEVIAYDIEQIGDRRFYVYIRDASTAKLRELFAPVRLGGLVVVPPIRYHEDGTTSITAECSPADQ